MYDDVWQKILRSSSILRAVLTFGFNTLPFDGKYGLLMLLLFSNVISQKKIIANCSISVFRTFTRVPQLEYIGEANEEINNVRSIEECRNLCLEASVYQCRSATYDSNARVCRLTEETRRSAPSDFRIAERGVDYIENECADSKYKIHVS